MNGYKTRKINFGPGPAQLPFEVWERDVNADGWRKDVWLFKVLENVQAEFLDYEQSGLNVMGKRITGLENEQWFDVELSHRSSAFGKIIQNAERDIREIL